MRALILPKGMLGGLTPLPHRLRRHQGALARFEHVLPFRSAWRWSRIASVAGLANFPFALEFPTGSTALLARKVQLPPVNRSWLQRSDWSHTDSRQDYGMDGFG